MKVALLLSGGVDSSVALHLLLKQGHEVECFYLKIWLEDELAFLGECPWEEDLENVHAVTKHYSVPLHIIPLQKEYWEQVVGSALDDLKRGFTPSPDIWCNERVKFGVFWDVLMQRFPGFEVVASGHYAQVQCVNIDGREVYFLTKAKDTVKDQTYFLSRLRQDQLAKIMFPIGGLLKSEVRQIASEQNLHNKNRKDSQGICFLGKIRYRDFVMYHLGEKDGEIIDEATGKLLGQHKGTWFYTIGQRQGLGLSGGPWFVSQKNIHTNTVYVRHGEDDLSGNKDHFYIRDIHWMSITGNKEEYEVKIRHSPSYNHAKLEKMENTSMRKVVLRDADNGIASGQSVIFYEGERCLGSATIETTVAF